MDQANGYSIANFQGRLNEQTPSSSSPSLSVPFPSPDPLLKSLPTTIALLTVAQSLRSAALSILPSLSKPPQSLNSQVRCAKTWSDYYRLTTTSIIVLRSAVTSASSGESRGGRIELRANAMLAQHLADLYEGTADAEAVVGEGEAALTKAQAISPMNRTSEPTADRSTELGAKSASTRDRLLSLDIRFGHSCSCPKF